MSGRLRAAAAILALALTTCSRGAADQVADPDFLGELVSADISRWQVEQADAGGHVAFAVGGPESPLLVGPATFELSDGTAVDVPAATPGGNACRALGFRDQPQRTVCTVVGELDEHGDVAWFATVALDRVDAERMTASVEGFQDRDAIIRLGEVLAPVPIRDDATLRCDHGDLSATPVDVPSGSKLAYLDRSFEVIDVECLYAE